MVKIIFHIGMGKTGTSSIQNALQTNTEVLAEQRAAYLGMWFDMLDAGFHGHLGLREFFSADAEAMAARAVHFHEILVDKEKRDGVDTFILSNESFFGNVLRIAPFLQELRARADIQLVAYIRNPHSWLPSAFTQWGIRHKQQKGPIQPFAKRARVLIGQYEGIRHWVKQFDDILDVRPHEKGIDVVRDFGAAMGLRLEPGQRRYLERDDPAETLLRALYNDRFADAVLPDRFDRVVINTNQAPVRSAHEMAALCFRYEENAEIIEEKRELFEFIRDRLGLDYLSENDQSISTPDPEELQSRVIDYLIEVSLDQAQRLKRLERVVNEMQNSQW